MNGYLRVVPVLLAFVLGILDVSDAAEDRPQSFKQDTLVIGFWGDPPADNRVNKRYAEVERANFTVVMGGVGADSPTKAKKQRDACKRVGLLVLFSTYGLPVEKLCDCDTTYGFLVKDRPAMTEFGAVLDRVKEVREKRPGKLPFVNLAPYNAGQDVTGTADYGVYLNSFIDTVRPEVLCSDLYPDVPPTGDGREAYRANLAILREASLRAGVPFWSFVKAMGYLSPGVPTEAQVRWQVFAALAHGSKGILYFAYWLPEGTADTHGDGVLTAAGKRTPRYDEIRVLNGQLRNLGPTLMALKSVSVQRADGPIAGLPVTGLESSSPDGFLAGVFSHKDGRRAALIMNNAWDDSDVTATITLSCPQDAVREVGKDHGREIALRDEDPAADGIQLVFRGGEGRLLLFPAE